uniref:non-specific serine/threonine protein kinase n=1 Tax=Oryzias latipes TaxID=8090 RepID=A0A3B3IL29_ORYLA
FVHAELWSSDALLDVQPLPGQGGFGKVFLCCEVDGTSKPLEAVALEMVSKDPPFPGIIRMLDFYKTRGAWVIITEKPENTQDLFDYITTCKLLREDTAREFLGQVIQALLHCHSRGVVHMDVKDENLLLDLSTRKLLLIDFGSAVFLKPDKEYDTFDGTATYAPPERLTRGCYKALPSEVWSLRILLYDMVHGDIGLRGPDKMVFEQHARRETDAERHTGPHLDAEARLGGARGPRT